MDGLIMAAQIILSLSILVGLHEMGHMLTAKMFGMRVEQFSIGFPPKIFKFKKGDTEYAIGSIPLGGFVKISGMVDESLDTKNLSEEPKPYEFRAKPAWQRLIVMIGGIVVNVITGIVISVILVFSYGEPYLSKEEVNKYGIVANELGQEIGLQTGDRILQINGRDYQQFSDLKGIDVLLESNSYYTVERNGEILQIPIPQDFIEKFSDKDAGDRFIEPRSPFVVGEVQEGSNAEKAGLKEGDKIVAINGEKVDYYDEFETVKSRNSNSEITLAVERPVENNGVNALNIDVQVDEQGLIGFRPKSLLSSSFRDYSLGESVVEGTERAFNAVYVNVIALGKIFRGELSPTKSLSGPIAIARVFGGEWDWYRFWSLTGLISMVLAFMNLLPIPALDGGHVMFLLFEMVSGRKPSDKFLEVAQKTGMVLLLALMVFVIFNDIRKIIVDFFGNMT
jgi:regulator of sigma E protease